MKAPKNIRLGLVFMLLGCIALIVAALCFLVSRVPGCRCNVRIIPGIAVPGSQYASEEALCDDAYFREIPDFLTGAQCDALIAAASQRPMKPSTIGITTGSHVSNNIRDSENTWFFPGEHDIADLVRAKTRALLRSIPGSTMPEAYGMEALQVARYGQGGKYTNHFDADECGAPGFMECSATQRLCTMLIYLNEPDEGGETHFPLLGHSVKPRKGKALFFWVSDPVTRKVFQKTLHAGLPVTRGTKWIANQWVLASSPS